MHNPKEVKSSSPNLDVRSSSSSNKLRPLSIGLTEELVRRTLHDTASDRQRAAHASEVRVDVARAHTALVDAPDDQTLAAAAVTSRENALDVGAVLARRGLDVLAGILLDHAGHDLLLGAEEAHGQQNEVGGENLLAAFDLLHIPAAGGGFGPLDTDSLDALDVAFAVVDELFGHDAILARVLAHVGLDFGVAVVDSVDTGPLWPWVVAGALRRRLREQLEVDDVLGTVTDGSTNAVVTSVTTTDDDNVLALGGDVGIVGQLRVEQRLGVLVQELHGEVDALEVAVGNGKVARNGGTSGDDHRVVVRLERLKGDIALADEAAGDVLDTLSSHEVYTALNHVLVELHVGDTVHEQTTDTVGTLVNGDLVTRLVELVGGSETCRTGTNDSNSLAGAILGWGGDHPAHLETTVDNGTLDGLDADGILIDAKDTSALARSGADTTSKFGEVVGHEQTVESVLPLVLLGKKCQQRLSYAHGG
jgi:hypothetical protein